MIRLQDIADMVGVSRTTVSNVLHGKTKRVSKQTIDKITAILDEQGYVPNMGSMILSSNVSHIIGVILGYKESHGFNAMQDPFVSEVVGVLEVEASKAEYYIMLIGGKEIDNIVNIASRWNIDGLIALGFEENDYYALKKKLNKPLVLIDAYPDDSSDIVNVGIDDYSGGYQIGRYLLEMGYDRAIFIAETRIQSDYNRWLGFKDAMEARGDHCDESRYVVVMHDVQYRLMQYERLLHTFLEMGALAFTSDYLALEAINFFADRGIKVPEQISVTGYDDNMYAKLVRPKLTTVNQDVSLKAEVAFELLLKIIRDEPINNRQPNIGVNLVIRESVREKSK